MNKEETITQLMTYAHNGELTDNDFKYIFEDLSFFAGLKDLTTFARSENISAPAALKRKNQRVIISGHKFIIDNE